ncbi:MAG: ABC transporter permease [Chitinophagales bacterium]|nr:ABC transporter permease [Chitinophagales bacterium]
MNLSFFISKRIVKNEARSFSRLIVIIARIAIALSLAVMIISSAMVDGFRETIAGNIYGFWGHINIAKESLRNGYDDLPIDRNAEFIENVYAIPGIEHINGYARKAGIIKTKTDIEGIILKGVGTDFNWDSFQKYIVGGNRFIAGDTVPSNGLVISKSTSDRLKIGLGDSVILHFIDQDANGDYQQRFRKLYINGIYKTGLEEFDKLFALADIKHIQKLNDWSSEQVGGYEVFIDDVDKLDLLAEKVDQVADPFWDVQSIRQLIPSIFDWLNLQKINERIILALMIIVALINMITSLLILILERTNMIGILKALGATNWTIRKIFLSNAGYIVLWGMFWGNVIGVLICIVQKEFGILKLPEQSYYVSVAPVSLDLWWIILMNAGTFVICMSALLVPSILVSKIQPVKAIRFN